MGLLNKLRALKDAVAIFSRGLEISRVFHPYCEHKYCLDECTALTVRAREFPTLGIRRMRAMSTRCVLVNNNRGELAVRRGDEMEVLLSKLESILWLNFLASHYPGALFHPN